MKAHAKNHRSPKSWVANQSILAVAMIASVTFNFALLMLQRGGSTRRTDLDGSGNAHPIKWNGGHPDRVPTGTCWCSHDTYCMCTPNMAIDLVITTGENREDVMLVRRRDTGFLAVMGGFVEVGETPEQAVKREIKEEMHLDLTQDVPLNLLGIYGDPRRDARRHTTSVVYGVHLSPELRSQAHAGDDAKEIITMKLDDIDKPEHKFFADHYTILTDYRESVGHRPAVMTKHKLSDLERSTCSSRII